MDWLEDKLPMPSVAEILLNNIGHINESAMVHSSFFYAKNGGSQFLADTLARGLKVRYRQEAVNILPKDGKWLVQGELFDRVVFTGNVRQLGDCFPCVDELRPFSPGFQNCALTEPLPCFAGFPPMITAGFTCPLRPTVPTGSFARGIFPEIIITGTSPPRLLNFPSK